MSNATKALADRLQAWQCARCGQRVMRMECFPYSCQVGHDDTMYDVTVPDLEAPRCQNCGAIVLTSAANERIDNAFRVKAGLMAPADIRRRREARGLTA